MRARSLTLAVALGLLLAGCTMLDEPEESTGIDETDLTNDSGSGPAAVTPTPTPVEPTPTSPVDPIGEVDINVREPPQESTEPPAEDGSNDDGATGGDDPPADDGGNDPPADDGDDPPADDADDPPADDGDDPPADDGDDGDAWPREGSYVTIRGSSGESFPDTYSNRSQWVATWTYRDGDWVGECDERWVHDWDEGIGEEDASGTIHRELTPDDPPHWPLFNTRNVPDVGEEITVWVMWGCEIQSERMIYAGLDADGYHTAEDTQEAEENYSDFDTRWDPDTGLVLSFSHARRHSSTSGTTQTDAPGL